MSGTQKRSNGMFNHPRRTANSILQILAHGKPSNSMKDKLEGILEKIHAGRWPSQRESQIVEDMFQALN
jgi:hypothetical protein